MLLRVNFEPRPLPFEESSVDLAKARLRSIGARPVNGELELRLCVGIKGFDFSGYFLRADVLEDGRDVARLQKFAESVRAETSIVCEHKNFARLERIINLLVD